MRIGTKIKSLILLFVAFCLSVVFGVVSFGEVKRVSGASANIVSTELNVAGASLRYANTQDKAAARYHVTISDALYENTVAQGRETGILVIPNAVLAGKELNLDTPSAKKGVFSNGDVNNWERNAQGDYEARAFIDNIPAKNYGTKLAVVAYAETSNGLVYSELYNTSSLSAIAVAEANSTPDSASVEKLLNTYATFDVTINGTVHKYLYGETIPFASALGLADASNADRKWSENGKVTGPLSLTSTASAVDIGAQELDLDVNLDGSANSSKYVDFDITKLNAGALKFGTDYTLKSVSVGESALSSVEGAYVENNKLFLPASLIDVKTWGEKDVTLTFNYQGIDINVTANDSLVVTKKISDVTELKAFYTIADVVAGDSTGGQWAGYFQLDADVTLNTTAMFDGAGGWTLWTNNMENGEGFVGVFDGCGYAINGYMSNSDGFIDVIGAKGTLKNVSFTNAVIMAHSSVISEFNNGLVENVYVHAYSIGGWFTATSGLGKDGTWFDDGNTAWNLAVVNGGTYNATGTLRNVFIDITDSAKVTTAENANKGKSWHDDEKGFCVLGLSSGAKFEGVYIIGAPETGAWATTFNSGIINGVNPLTGKKSETRWWSTDKAAFMAVYNDNAEIKAKVDAWPVFMKDKLGLVGVETLTARQEINLDVQINNTTKVISTSTGTATISLAEASAFTSVEKVTFDGKDIDFKLSGTTLTLDVADFGYVGGEYTLYITTDKAIVSAPVLLVTKVLKTKADLQDFGYISKAVYASNDKLWGGYFKLGNDIEFNDTWKAFIAGGPGNTTPPTTGAGLSWAFADGGFAGTFDGDGHKIIGMTMSGWANSTTHAFIGVLKGGTIKDVAFTNTTNTGNGAIVTLGGSGTIENVYVQYTKFYAGATEGPATFFALSSPSSTADLTIKNCFVDLSKAAFTTNAANTVAGVIGSTAKVSGSSFAGGDFTGKLENVYAVSAKHDAFHDPIEKVSEEEAGNTTVYAGVGAFIDAYATDSVMAYTFDTLNDMFGIALDNSLPAFGTVDEGEIDLDVKVENGTAVVNTATATFYVSKVASDLTEFVSLSYNGAEPITSGVTVNGAKVTVPVAGQIAPTSYTDKADYNLTLVAKNANGKVYNITIPTALVTKTIKTKADLNSFLSIADVVADDEVKTTGSTGRTWGGYFKLGADIVFNTTADINKGSKDLPLWNYDMDRRAGDTDASYSEGFVGIFDGCGYAIEGLVMTSTAFIDVIGANGIVRNVAFNNAVVTQGASVISEQVNGLVENVYVSMYSVGGYHSTKWGGFGGSGAWYTDGWCTANTTVVNNSYMATGTLKNVVIDITGSNKVNTESDPAKSGKTWHDDADGPSLLGLSENAKFEGVYLIGVPEEGTWATTAAGIINGVKASEVAKKTEARSWYENNDDFVSAYLENATIKATVDAWPVWMKELVGAVETVDGGDLDLNVQVESSTKTVSLNGEEVEISLGRKLGGEIVSVKMGEEQLYYARIEGEKLYIPAEQFGFNYGERTLNVKTTEDLLNVNVFLITKEIYTKDDLDNFGLIAKAVRSDNDKMWGGYFRLAQDIPYNATWKSFIAVGTSVKGNSTGAALSWGYSAGGFEGVFDGNGKKIIGMAMSGWVDSNVHAFIGTLKGGTIKDLAFTNARLIAAGALVTLGGTGTVENVYVKYEQFVAPTNYLPDTAQNTEGFGTFFHQAAGSNHVCAITLKNCFVNLVGAYQGTSTNERAAGVIGSLNKYQNGWQGATDYTGTMTNVYAVGNSKNFPVVFEKDPANSVVSAAELGNTELFVDEKEFSKAYYKDATLKAAYDMLNAKFGIGLNLADISDVSIDVEDAVTLNLDVTTEYSNWDESAATLTYGEPVAQATAFTLDLNKGEAEGEEFAQVSDVQIDNGKQTRSIARNTLTGVTLANNIITIPVKGNFSATDYFDGYTLKVTATTEMGKPYHFTFKDVDLVSMVIESKDDLQKFGPVALAIGAKTGTPFDYTQSNDKEGTADGYFVLGADIDFGSTFDTRKSDYLKPFMMRRVEMNNDRNNGFVGIFDGRNYVISNLAEYSKAGEGGFITALGEKGVLRNISFTDAYLGGNGACFVSWRGKGLYENIYVQYAKDGWGLTDSNTAGNVSTFFGYVAENSASGMDEVKLVNCFVDFSKIDMTKLYTPWGNSANESSERVGVPIDPVAGVTGMVAKVKNTGSINGVYSIGLKDGIVRSDRANQYIYNYASNAIVDARNSVKTPYWYRTKDANGNYAWAQNVNGGLTIGNSPDGSVKGSIGAFDNNGLWGNWATAQDMANAYNEAGSSIRTMLSTWDADVWKVVGGVPSPKYASTAGMVMLDLDLVPVYDDATKVLIGVVPGNGWTELKISDIDTKFGTLVSAYYGNTNLNGVFNENTNVLRVETSAFGTKYGQDSITLTFCDEFGKNHTFSIGVMLVSKMISNADELNQMGAIAKALGTSEIIWDGYFVFDDDIEYNGKFTPFIDVSSGVNVDANTQSNWKAVTALDGKEYWTYNGKYVYSYINWKSAKIETSADLSTISTFKQSNASTGSILGWSYNGNQGFTGVIDGQGHTISGLKMLNQWTANNSFVPSNNGTIKNLAFINAEKNYNGGYVSTGGAGTIENVYVKYSAFASAQSTDGSGTFFAQPNGNDKTLSMNLVNCFVDASAVATAATNAGMVGSAGANVSAFNGSFDGVYAVSGANNVALRDASTGTVITPVWNTATTAGKAGSFASQADFVTAYNNFGTLYQTVKAYPDWMKKLVFAGATNVQDPLAGYFVKEGVTEYSIVIGTLGANETQAIEYVNKLVKEQTGAKLTYARASEWTKDMHYVVVNDWNLFHQAFSTENPLNGANYGVFTKGNSIFVMAEDNADLGLAVVKFLSEVLGYRQYSGDARGAQALSKTESTYTLNQLADGTVIADVEGYGECLNVDGNSIKLPGEINFCNDVMFAYRLAGPFTTMNNEGAYSMGTNKYTQHAGNWHNMTSNGDLVPASQAYVVDGVTYGAYERNTNTHKWYASMDDYVTYDDNDNVTARYWPAGAEIQVCFTAHGDATAYAHLVKVYGDAIIRLANNNPKKDVMLLTTEDNSNACTCSSCTAFGSAAATYLNFVNDVEQYVNNGTVTLAGGTTITTDGTYSINGTKTTFATLDRSTPVRIGYFAYQAYQTTPYVNDASKVADYARVEPKTMDANHLSKADQLNVLYPNTNTLLVLAPGGAISDTPMNEGRNLTESWSEKHPANWYDMQVWLEITSKQGANIYLWSYELMQGDWFLSRNSFESTVANYRLFAENGNMEVMSTENLWSKSNVTAFGALKAYINSQALMEVNKYVDIDEKTGLVDKTSLNKYCQKLIDEFFGLKRDVFGNLTNTGTGKGYYGAGGVEMYKLYLEYRAAQYLFTEMDDQIATYKGEKGTETYKNADFGTTKAQSWTIDWNALNLTVDNVKATTFYGQDKSGNFTGEDFYWIADYARLKIGVKASVTKAIPQHEKSSVGSQELGLVTTYYYQATGTWTSENDNVSNINRWLGYVATAHSKVSEETYQKHILVESLMPRWIATGGLLWAGEALGVENGAFSTPGTAKVGDWNTNAATSKDKLQQNYGGTNPDFLENDVTPDGLYGYVVNGTKWVTGIWNVTEKSVTWTFGLGDDLIKKTDYAKDYESTIPVGDGTMNGYAEKTYEDDATHLEAFRRDFLMDAKMLGYEHYASGKGANLMFVEYSNRYKGNYSSNSNAKQKQMVWISDTSNRVFGVINPSNFY